MHGLHLKERKATEIAPLVMKMKEEGHFGLEGEATLISRLTFLSLRDD